MKVSQAILPVAGLGTRFLPWTKVVPKELLPVGNQPIIALIVDECLHAGIRDICFVISHGKEAIPEYFFEDPALEKELERRGKLHHLEHLRRYSEIRFHVVYQDEQHGDGHAILQAKDWVESDTVAVCFGDDLFTGPKSGIQQLIEAQAALPQHAHGAFLALENIPREKTGRYGIVDPEEAHPKHPHLRVIKGLVEKPAPEDAPSTLGIVGRYLIPRSTFGVLPSVAAGHGGEIRLIDALIAQLGQIPIIGCECSGTRLDTGTPEGYAHAVQALSESSGS